MRRTVRAADGTCGGGGGAAEAPTEKPAVQSTLRLMCPSLLLGRHEKHSEESRCLSSCSLQVSCAWEELFFWNGWHVPFPQQRRRASFCGFLEFAVFPEEGLDGPPMKLCRKTWPAPWAVACPIK